MIQRGMRLFAIAARWGQRALPLVCLTCAAAEVPLGSVGKTPLTPEMVQATAARNGYEIRDVASAERALKETVEFESLAAMAEKEGYFADPEIVATVKAMAVRKLVAEKVDKAHPPKTLTEDQLSAYYKEHQEEFSHPAIAKGRVLFVAKKEGWEKKTEEVEVALKKKTPTFADVLKKVSDDAAGRVSGGLTPWLVEKRESRRYPKEVVAALFALKTQSEISPRIDMPNGVYWVQLVELRSGNVTPYETAKRTISRKLAERERIDAYGTYVAGLKDAVPVTIDPLAVSNLLKNVTSGALPPMGPVRIRPRE